MTQNKNKSSTETKNLSDFFDNLGSRAYLMALLLIMAVAFFVFKDFLLLKNVFQFKDIGSDTLNGMLPYYKHYADYLRQNGLPGWSFAEGFGQGIMSGFLRDPFQLISMLAGPESMPKIFIYIEVLKIVIAGLIFFFFLKTIKVSNYSAILGSMLFSFCGFMIIGACWYLFTFEALNMALLLLGFEKLYQKNQWFIFALGICLTAISFPVNLFTYGLFILFYAAFRFLNDNKFDRKSLFTLYGKTILVGLIGLLISGPFLLENVFQLLESPRASGADSYFSKLSSSPMFALSNKVEFGSSVMRMFSNDMLGTGNGFTGVQNYLEAPFGYCGLISLLLVVQVFSFMDKFKRNIYITLFAIWLIPTIFPYFRYAFWLFSGDYFRIYSFFVSLIFILYSVQALDIILKNKKVNLISLIATLLFWFIVGSLSYKTTITYPNGQQAVQELKTDDTVSFFVKTFLVFYAVLLYAFGKSTNVRAIKIILLILVCFELMFLSQISVNHRNVVSVRELKEKTGYNDYSVEAVNFIKSRENGFYRIDKSYYSSGAMHGSITDHKVHGYYGTSSYNSFAQMNFINYMRGFDVIDKTSEYASRWVDGLKNRPFLESLNHVKYMLTKSTTLNPMWISTFDSVAKFGDVVVLKHKYSLPFGYTYNKYILQTDFQTLSTTQKDLVSLKACVLDESETIKANSLSHFYLKDTIGLNNFTWDYFKNAIDTLKQEYLETNVFSENKIEGKITVSNSKMIYLSFPYDKGWHIYIDGKEVEKSLVNFGMTGIMVPKGSHQILCKYHLRFFNKGWLLSLLGLILAGTYWYVSRKKQLISGKL